MLHRYHIHILYIIYQKNVGTVRPPTRTRYQIARTAVGLDVSPAPKPGTKLKTSALRYALEIHQHSIFSEYSGIFMDIL